MYASNTKSAQEAQADLARERQQAEQALVNVHAQAKGAPVIGAVLQASAAAWFALIVKPASACAATVRVCVEHH